MMKCIGNQSMQTMEKRGIEQHSSVCLLYVNPYLIMYKTLAISK